MVTGILNKIGKFTKMTKPNVVFVLGAPGSGKGTQCAKIVEHFGFVHLSAGDLLREERSRPDSKYGELIESYIREGKIVPVEITCSLLKRAMQQSEKNRFLIDGFPRNQDNLNGWNVQMGNKVNLMFVLYFDCPDDICIERCLNRGKNSGRVDDNVDSLRKRFQTFAFETRPIIEYYDKLQLVKKVDAAKDPDDVFEDVKQLFNFL